MSAAGNDPPPRRRRRRSQPAVTLRDELPRLLERPHGSTLLTRDEVADLLGYSRTSMATVMGRDRDRWPRPAAMLRTGVRSWAMLWDRDEILAAAPPATAGQRSGVAATISDPDGLLTCLECGLRFRALGRHLRVKHDMAGAEYREAHQLPATGALTADGQRQRARDYWLERLAGDPDALDHLTPWQGADHLRRLLDDAIESHHQTRGRALVREHRAPGQRYAVQVMLARRRAKLDQTARAAGFESFAAAMAATAHLSAAAAARRIRVGASTVRRHRNQQGL